VQRKLRTENLHSASHQLVSLSLGFHTDSADTPVSRFPSFYRDTSSKIKIENISDSANISGEDPLRNKETELATTETKVAGRRLRSDSPTEDGAFESQPLKRQNSLGDGEFSFSMRLIYKINVFILFDTPRLISNLYFNLLLQ
jgi:hypothetical protein